MSVCYLSTGAFRTRSLEEILFQCQRYEITHLELSSGLEPVDFPLDDERFKEVGPCLVHNYFPPPATPFVLNLAADDAGTLQASLDLCRRAIDLSAALGAPFYSVHGGFVATLTPSQLGDADAQAILARGVDAEAHERAFDRFCESMAALAGYARAAGIQLLIENNVQARRPVGARHLLMVTAEDFERFFARLNDHHLGVLVDVGHLIVSGKTCDFMPSEFCLRLAHRIRAFHLSENDGWADQNLPVKTDSWFWPIVRQFPEAILVLEAYNLSISHMLQQRELIAAQRELSRPLSHALHSR